MSGSKRGHAAFERTTTSMTATSTATTAQTNHRNPAGDICCLDPRISPCPRLPEIPSRSFSPEGWVGIGLWRRRIATAGLDFARGSRHKALSMAATLNRLSLTFAPPEAERRYHAARADADLRIMRWTYALGIALSSAYFIFDYLALGRFEPMLLAVRLIVVNAVIAAGLAATWMPGLKRRSAHIGGWVFLFHLVFFAAVNGYYPTPYVYTANGIITLGFLYLVWPLSLGMSCAYGIVGTAVYCAIVIAARPWSAEIELLLLIFASMNCICIFALYETEYYRRSTYLSMQALDVERSRYHELLTSILPKEVADRLQRGETVTDHYDDVSVLFVDLCD